MIVNICILACAVLLAFINWDNTEAFWGWTCAALGAVSNFLNERKIAELESLK